MRAFAYMAALSFATICLMPVASRWMGITWNAEMNTVISGGYLIYPLLGYLLTHWKPNGWQRTVIYALGLGALVLRTVMTWRLSTQAGMVVYTYGTYLNFPCVLQALAVFVAFQRLRVQSERVIRGVRWLSTASLSVYFTQMFIRDVLVRLNAEPAWIAQTGVAFRAVAVCDLRPRRRAVCRCQPHTGDQAPVSVTECSRAFFAIHMGCCNTACLLRASNPGIRCPRRKKLMIDVSCRCGARDIKRSKVTAPH